MIDRTEMSNGRLRPLAGERVLTLPLERNKESRAETLKLVGSMMGVDESYWEEIARQAVGHKWVVTYKGIKLHLWLLNPHSHPSLADFDVAGRKQYADIKYKIPNEIKWQLSFSTRPWVGPSRVVHESNFLCAKLSATSDDEARFQGIHGLWEIATNRELHLQIIFNADRLETISSCLFMKASETGNVIEVACMAAKLVWSLGVTNSMRDLIAETSIIDGLLFMLSVATGQTELPEPSAAAVARREQMVRAAQTAGGGGGAAADAASTAAGPQGGGVEPGESSNEQSSDGPIAEDGWGGLSASQIAELEACALGALEMLVVDVSCREVLFRKLVPTLVLLVKIASSSKDSESVKCEWHRQRRAWAAQIICSMLVRDSTCRIKFAEADGIPHVLPLLHSDDTMVRLATTVGLSVYAKDQDGIEAMGNATLAPSAILAELVNVCDWADDRMDEEGFLQTPDHHLIKPVLESAAQALWGAAQACVHSGHLPDEILLQMCDFLEDLAEDRLSVGSTTESTISALASFASNRQMASQILDLHANGSAVQPYKAIWEVIKRGNLRNKGKGGARAKAVAAIGLAAFHAESDQGEACLVGLHRTALVKEQCIEMVCAAAPKTEADAQRLMPELELACCATLMYLSTPTITYTLEELKLITDRYSFVMKRSLTCVQWLAAGIWAISRSNENRTKLIELGTVELLISSLHVWNVTSLEGKYIHESLTFSSFAVAALWLLLLEADEEIPEDFKAIYEETQTAVWSVPAVPVKLNWAHERPELSILVLNCLFDTIESIVSARFETGLGAKTCELAAGLSWNMTDRDLVLEQHVIERGGHGILLGIAANDSAPPSLRCVAARHVQSLMRHKNNISAIGGLQPLAQVYAQFLRTEHRDLHSAAAVGFAYMTQDSSSAQSMIGSIGGTDALSRLLRKLVFRGEIEGDLIMLTLTALLNLTRNSDNQMRVCAQALHTLLMINAQSEDEEMLKRACGILYNLSTNPANATRMYKAELWYKSQQCAEEGGIRSPRGSEESFDSQVSTASRPGSAAARGMSRATSRASTRADASSRPSSAHVAGTSRPASRLLPSRPVSRVGASRSPSRVAGGPSVAGEPSATLEPGERGSGVARPKSAPVKQRFEDWHTSTFKRKGIPFSGSSTSSYSSFLRGGSEVQDSYVSSAQSRLPSAGTRLPPRGAAPPKVLNQHLRKSKYSLWKPVATEPKPATLSPRSHMPLTEKGVPVNSPWQPPVREYQQQPIQQPLIGCASHLMKAPRPSSAKRRLDQTAELAARIAADRTLHINHLEVPSIQDAAHPPDHPEFDSVHVATELPSSHLERPTVVMLRGGTPAPTTTPRARDDAEEASAKDAFPSDEGEAPQPSAQREAPKAAVPQLPLQVVLDQAKASAPINFKLTLSPRIAEGVPRLTVWEHVAGSRVAEDAGITPFLLPNGKRAFYFLEEQKLADRIYVSLGRAAARPDKLSLALQQRLPPTQVLFDLIEGSSSMKLFLKPTPMICPRPDQHTLRVKEPNNFVPSAFGNLVMDNVLFGVEVEETQKKEEVLKPPAKSQKKPWSLPTSIFQDREKDSDVKGFFNSDDASSKSFGIDIKRAQDGGMALFLSTELEKAHNQMDEVEFIKKFKNRDTALRMELKEVQACISEHFLIISKVFSYYAAALGKIDLSDEHAPLQMRLDGFLAFCTDCHITDPLSKYCKPDAINRYFTLANVELEAGAKDLLNKNKTVNAKTAAALNEANDDSCLMRFEFLKAVVRLAVNKYGRGIRTLDVSDAVDMLIQNNIVSDADGGLIAADLPAEALNDPNAFRQFRLYKEDVDEAFKKELDWLAPLYERYSAKPESAKHKPGVTLSRFLLLLKEAHILDGPGPVCAGFTEKDARVIFLWSRMQFFDEVQEAASGYILSFVDFLEALGRVADVLAWPALEDLYARFPGIVEYEEAAAKDPKKHFQHRPSAHMLPTLPSQRPLEEKLNLLFAKIRPTCRQLLGLDSKTE